jgi:hypothetical protein
MKKILVNEDLIPYNPKNIIELMLKYIILELTLILLNYQNSNSILFSNNFLLSNLLALMLPEILPKLLLSKSKSLI